MVIFVKNCYRRADVDDDDDDDVDDVDDDDVDDDDVDDDDDDDDEDDDEDDDGDDDTEDDDDDDNDDDGDDDDGHDDYDDDDEDDNDQNLGEHMTMIRTGEDMLSVAVLAQTRIGPVLIMPGHGHKPHFLQCQWCGQWGSLSNAKCVAMPTLPKGGGGCATPRDTKPGMSVASCANTVSSHLGEIFSNWNLRDTSMWRPTTDS